jgi:hypothetical protein
MPFIQRLHSSVVYPTTNEISTAVRRERPLKREEIGKRGSRRLVLMLEAEELSLGGKKLKCDFRSR